MPGKFNGGQRVNGGRLLSKVIISEKAADDLRFNVLETGASAIHKVARYIEVGAEAERRQLERAVQPAAGRR